MAPSYYDPNSPDEQPVALPSAPLCRLADNAVVQPPLTRRGTGPGLIIFLPSQTAYKPSNRAEKPLDPQPVQKWAEEGFAVVGITSGPGWSVSTGLQEGIQALLSLNELDTRDKFAVIVYDPKIVSALLAFAESNPRLVGVVLYASEAQSSTVPSLFHLPRSGAKPAAGQIYTYSAPSPYFALPQAEDFDPASAAVAHTRSLVFLRNVLGGPSFDLEAIWDEHTYFEFEVRSVAKTMGTMVAEPYVNHVPTMTGGIGRKNLTAFYRDHFIFSNPPDASLQLVSRTVGADRVIDEFIFHLTHDRTVDWLLPGVPPTGKKLAVPMMAVVNVRGDRLYHEHIWWDQATCLLQAGLVPSHVPYGPGQQLRLPVAGVECTRLLVDETDGQSNEMMEWGIQNL